MRLAFGAGLVAALPWVAWARSGVRLAAPAQGDRAQLLFAFLALRLALVVGGFLLAPGGNDVHNVERFRIVPMGTEAARFWHARLGLLVGWFAFGWVTAALLSVLGFSLDARHVVAYLLGLGLLAIGLEMVWRRPDAVGDRPPGPAAARRTARSILLSVYFVALWAWRVAGAIPAFWLAVVAVALPAAIGVTQRSVNHPATARRGCRYRAAEGARRHSSSAACGPH